MTEVNKEELRRLADAQKVKLWSRGAGAVTHRPSRDLMFAVSGPDVVSDYEDWGFTRAAASYIAAACPANVLSLLDENEQLRNQLRLSGISAELAIHDQVGRAVTGQLSAEVERDQLRAEVKGVRAFLSEVSRTSGDKWAVLMARDLLGVSEVEESDCINSLKAVRRDSDRYRWLRDKAVDAEGVYPMVSLSDETGEKVSNWLYGRGLDESVDSARAKEGGANG